MVCVVNFMDQLDWATKCLDIQLNVTLDVSVSVWMKLASELLDIVKLIALPMWVGITQPIESWNRRKKR